MTKIPNGGRCVGGPMDGEYIKSVNVHVPLPTGNYVYRGQRFTKPKTWLWQPRADDAINVDQQLEAK